MRLRPVTLRPSVRSRRGREEDRRRHPRGNALAVRSVRDASMVALRPVIEDQMPPPPSGARAVRMSSGLLRIRACRPYGRGGIDGKTGGGIDVGPSLD